MSACFSLRALGVLLACAWVGLGQAEAQPAAAHAAETGAGSCVACEAEPDVVLGRYGAAERAALRRGEVVVAADRGDGGHAVRAALRVAAPPSRVWDVLTAYERWPEFVPRLAGLDILSREGDRVRLRHRVRVLGMDIRYGTVRTLDAREGRIRTWLDPAQENDLDRSRSRWRIVPLEKGDATLVEVRARVEAGWWIPGFVQRALVSETLPRQLEAFRSEIHRRGPHVATQTPSPARDS